MLRTTDAELSRLQAAIAGGDAPETLLSGIRDCERKRKDFVSELSARIAARSKASDRTPPAANVPTRVETRARPADSPPVAPKPRRSGSTTT